MTTRMQALLKADAQPGLSLQEIRRPEVGPSEVRIDVSAASICGTDRHIYDWDDWAASRVRPPRVLGHEFCGHVEAVGSDAKGFREGDFVSVESHLVCGNCFQCRTGNSHVCQRVEILGIDRDGAFADYVVVPASNVWPVDPRVPREWASVFDPFGNAVHTVYSVDVRSQRVALFGCGSIGLFAVAVARAIGAEAVYAVDVVDYRLQLAERVGATATCDASTSDPVAWLRDQTIDHGGVDVVLEMSGNAKALNQGLRALRDGGRVAILGIPSKEVSIDVARDVVFKGATLIGIIGRRIWDTWYQMQSLLVDGKVDLEPILTHRMQLSAFEEAFTLLGDGRCGKIVLTPDARTLTAREER